MLLIALAPRRYKPALQFQSVALTVMLDAEEMM